MYELFEFVRVFSVKSNRPENHSGKVDIVKFAWKEEGEISFLALLCSNDYLVLRHSVTGRAPIIKQLPWPALEQIVSMCFDPMMTSLLVVPGNSNKLFIIPALALVNPAALVNQMFAKDDVTVRSHDNTQGSVTCAVWWQTLDGKQVAIIATSVGEIIFIDLLESDKQETRLTIDATVTDLSLSSDDSHMNTTLLITTVTGNQWHLLLETRTSESHFSPDSDLSDLGYDHIEGRAIPPRTILDAVEENSILFTPRQFQIFQPPTLLRPQYAKGHHFITAHCASTSTLQVMDPSAEHSPLFVYKLPADAGRAILTDVLIFTTINHSRDRKLIALSNQKAENSGENQQEFEAASVVQEFLLPEDETLLGVERKRFPFYFHEHREHEYNKWRETADDNGVGGGGGGGRLYPQYMSYDDLDPAAFSIPVRVHTVLDGCLVITNNSLYEVRPRVSPERLFLHLALVLPETSVAEDLAISIGLDLTTLSELGADYMLKQSHFSKAMKLYTLSKCPATKRTGNLARHGCISEVTVQLRQVLSSPGYDLNPNERRFLSNMLLHCFVYQLQRGGKTSSPIANTHAGLKDFLMGSFSFDERTALVLLSDFKLVDLLLSLAKGRGLVMDALRLLVTSETFHAIPFLALSDLVQKGFTAHLIQSEMLPCLSGADRVKLLITRPQLAIQNYALLQPIVPSLPPPSLLEVAAIFDPSKCVMKGILVRLQRSMKRANSFSSISSFTSESAENVPGELKEHHTEDLLEFFLLVVLQLNRLRRKETVQHPALTYDLLVGTDIQDIEQKVREEEGQQPHVQLFTQYQPVACGPKHAAAIRNGDLYTWGRSLHGRLGHGELPQAVCPPMRVETLHMLKLRVEAVSCGNEHTLALTHQGVYGWGNSKYGQVGVGTNHVYRRPMLLEALQSENVVGVACGMYHSLALTADHQVYSWGWGVHGQLGHGDVEDSLVPRHVKHLLNVKVVRVAGGYAHSLALNEEGQVLSFGCGYFGQLGTGTNTKSSVPQHVDIPDPVRNIATKYFHSLAVTDSNKVYVWGSHPHNLRQAASSIRQARHTGRQPPTYNPFLFPALVDLTYVQGNIVKVCCGSLHNMLVTEDGSLYVWGRNLEGQLGTGCRQDEPIPKMLTFLSNHQVCVGESGGEFSTAMDADGTVWLWGKNDVGQLGYVRPRSDHRPAHSKQTNSSSSGHHSSHSSHVHKSSTPSGHSSEFMTPTPIRGLPKVEPTNPSWISMRDALNDNRVWVESENPDSLSVVGSIPDFDHYGQKSYPSIVVPITLKVFENVLSTKFCLQKSVDFKDWVTAAHICCLEEDFVEALHYRFLAVVENMKENPSHDVISLCVQIVSHHIKSVIKKVIPKPMRAKELTSLCEEVLDFWKSHVFPVQALEPVFTDHLPVLSSWLIKTMLNPCTTTQQDESGDGGSPPKSLLFSTRFSLKVLNYCMKNPDTSLTPDLGLPSRSTHRQKTDNKNGGSSASADRLVNPQLKKTPQDRLLADILRNMRKDPGYISLTHSQMEHLQDQADALATKDNHQSRCVLFTCGHHYPESVFRTEAVPAMVSQLTNNGPKRLPNSAPLLQHLLLRPGLKAMACPKCVTHGLLSS